MIAAASIAARGVTIDPEQSDYYRGLGQELFSRWEDMTGEDYRSVDMGIKRTEYREDRYRKGALRALEHSLRLLPSAEAHVAMSHLLAPNGRAIRKAETRLALQLALADLSDPTLGAIEVRPFVASLDDTVDLPMRAPAGTVVAYDSKVTHRGGENYNPDGTARPVLYTTWAARDDGLLPRNLGYTIEDDDVGRWTLQGLVDAHAKPKAKTKRRKRR